MWHLWTGIYLLTKFSEFPAKACFCQKKFLSLIKILQNRDDSFMCTNLPFNIIIHHFFSRTNNRWELLSVWWREITFLLVFFSQFFIYFLRCIHVLFRKITNVSQEKHLLHLHWNNVLPFRWGSSEKFSWEGISDLVGFTIFPY